jgi:hypothetical protein
MRVFAGGFQIFFDSLLTKKSKQKVLVKSMKLFTTIRKFLAIKLFRDPIAAILTLKMLTRSHL